MKRDWWKTLVPVAVAATIALTTVVALRRTGGDFYATLPGGYARTLNPTLWNSPDLEHSWAFHKNTYLHGPVQYLALYPIVFLDSYRQIAIVLVPFYLAALALTYSFLLNSVRLLTGSRGFALPLLAMMTFFIPVLQAYVQREFEVIVLPLLAGGFLWLLRDRRAHAAAAWAFLAWFKYLPLIFVGYLALRRWGKAVLMFGLASAGIVLMSHALFGIQNFINNNVPGTAYRTVSLSGARFCEGWTPGNHTLANVRQGLCRVESYAGAPFARNAFIAICLMVAAAYLFSHWRMRRQHLDEATERWRRALEVSVVTTIYSCFFFGHYYYLSALLLPLSVLLSRYYSQRRSAALLMWGLVYLLLSGLIAPAWLVARMASLNGWQIYMAAAIYMYGELLLMGMLLWEYHLLVRDAVDGSRGAIPAHRPLAAAGL